jgi:hypothetical protein
MKGSSKMKSTNTLRWRGIGIALSAAILLTACGGGGDGGGPVPPIGGGPTPTPTASPVPPAFDPTAATLLNASTSVALFAADSQVGMDAQGNAIAVWIQPDGQRNNVFARRFNATSGTFEEQKFIGRNCCNGAFDLRLKVHSNGDAVAVWGQNDGATTNEEEDIVAAVYDHVTGTWTTKALTNQFDAPGVTDRARSVDAAFGPDGVIVATWRERRIITLGGDEVSLNSVKAATFDPTTKTWGGVEQVSPGLGNSSNTYDTPRVAVLPNKDVVVVAVEQAVANADSTQIILRRKTVGETTWGFGNVLANGAGQNGLTTPLEGRISDLALAANDAGQVQIVWRHEFTASGERQAIGTTFLGLGTKAWAPPGLVDFTAADPGTAGRIGKDSLQPNIVMDKSGKSTIVWRQDDQASGSTIKSVYAIQFDVTNNLFDGNPVLLEDKPEDTTGTPALSINATGNIFVAWAQVTATGATNVSSLFASQFDSTAKTWSKPATVEADETASTTSFSVAIAPNDTALAVWTQNNRVMFNRYK